MHANIDVHSQTIIAELPGDGMKYIEQLQSNFDNMTFAEEVGMIEPSSK